MHARVTWGAHEKSPDLHICRQITIILGCLGALGLSQSELNHCQLLGYSQQSSSAEGFKAENCVLLRQFTASLWTPICMPAPALVWVHYDWTDLIPMWYNIAYVPWFEDRGRTSLQRWTELQCKAACQMCCNSTLQTGESHCAWNSFLKLPGVMLVPVQGNLQQAAERELIMEGTAVEKSELQFVPLGHALSGHWRLGSCYVLASYSELFAWNPV